VKISSLETKKQDGRIGVWARVCWEDCDQPEKQIFIQTPDVPGHGLKADPNAFLVGCIIPALHFGEKRIAIEGQICPFLLEGLETVMALMRIWTKDQYRPLVIEPQKIAENNNLYDPGRHRAAMFYSGGIDSIAALRRNILQYPRSHPARVQDCFFIHGFDIGGVVARGMKYHVFDRGLEAMEKVTSAAGVNTVAVYTNIRHLCDERELWLNRFFGAVLAAVAHGFSSRLDLFFIASSYDFENLEPCGSHPLLDPEYSSYQLRIRHRDANLSRLDKLRIVAGWEPGFQNFRVCLANVEDRLNCGRCEKCVRTMTGLVAIDALHKTEAFAENDVTPEMFDAFKINIRHRQPFYLELLPELKKQGRMDLVDVITQKLSMNQR
jgi:hypothetical protein